MKLGASIAFAVLAVCASAASGGTVAGRIVFAANNAPTWSGHIYVSQGRGVRDLSEHSAGLDFVPEVSPDGTRIAFGSYRSGHTGIYVMRLDGSGTTRIRSFPGLAGANGDAEIQSIKWRPDSRSFAVLVYRRPTDEATIYLASASGGSRVLVKPGRKPGSLSGWTADGRLLLYLAPQAGGVEGVDSSGRTRFDVPGEAVTASSRGPIAVQSDSETWTLYSVAGRRLAVLPNVAAAAWSPNGSLLATTSAKGDLRVRTAGGKITTSARFPRASLIGWLGNRLLRLEANSIFGVSAATGRRVSLRLAYRQYSVVSAGDRVAALQFPTSFTPGTTVRLILGTVGGAARDVATFPLCADNAPISDLQLFGSTGLAYDSDCPGAQADIYSIAPDGSDLRQLTTSPYDDSQPAVSPDGTTIAFVRKDNEVHCGGCPETLWVMNADGSGARSFPNSPSQAAPFDDRPSFSPDGKTILFVRSGPSETGLFTVPTAGGAVHSLHLSGGFAVWGPSRIAYAAWPSGNASTVAPDGSGRAPVKGVHGDGIPAWSSDGRLAYLQTDQQGRYFITLPATGEKISLPQFTTYGLNGLAWSPDGTQFAFDATDESGISDVWTVRADGTHLTRITHGLGAVTSVAWR